MKLTGSFRFRLFLAFLLMAVIPLILISRMLIISYRNSVIQYKISELKYTCNILTGQMSGSSIQDALTEELTNELNWLAEYCGGRVLFVDSSYKVVFDSYGASVNKYCFSEDIILTFQGKSYSNYRDSTQFVEFTLPVSTRAASSQVDGVLVVSASESWIADMLKNMEEQALLFQNTAVIIMTAIAFMLSGAYTTPWKTLLQRLRQVLDGDWNSSISIDGSGYNETRQMADTFNQILERLKHLDETRQEFVSNVSHELKTPITSIRVLADSLMGEQEIPIEIYREFMSDISEEIDREAKIINDLLSLVRLDKTATSINISAVNINELLEQILKRLRPIAKQRSIELIFESFRPVIADVDETKISLAINNLVENAIKYNNDGGTVRVSLNADYKFWYLQVADNGVGIPEEFRDKIFERFYRVDKARSRETGGTGLGLAITKSVITLHNGRVKVDSTPGVGSTFSVRIPLKYVA